MPHEPAGDTAAIMVVPNGARRGKADRFYRWATGEGIAVQHILYAPSDVERLARHVATGRVPGPVQSLYVPGRYAPPEDGTVGHLRSFLDAARHFTDPPDWAACAFGRNETACLVQAVKAGGKARIGFENNLEGADGSPATDNAQRVAELKLALSRAGCGF